MKRSLGIFLCGLLLGGLIGYVSRRAPDVATGLATLRQSGPAEIGQARSGVEQRAEGQKILLGDIAAVPFQELYETLARQRPEEIVRLAQELDHSAPSQQTQTKIKAFFSAWAHLDPKASFDSAIGFRSAESRTVAIGATIAGADASATGAIASSIGELSPDVLSGSAKIGLFDQAIEKWSEADPAAAARLLSETKMEGARFTSAFYTVAQNWAATDPAAALAWAEKQNQVPFGLNAVSGAVLGWWKKDPAAAESYALIHLGTPLAKQLIPNLVLQMANQDRAKATAWVSNLRDGELRNQAYSMLASQLSLTDPKGASAWALTLPPDALSEAVESSVSMWAQTDPSAAAHWIEGLTGSTRDSAVSSYSYATAETDPATAAAWAATIGDEKMRARTLRRTTSQWLERDKAAAQAWIQNSSLGEAEKAVLLAAPAPSP